ncbi:MAG: hypothetical protein MUC59_15310 [Saprospiraceae bacterium]|nr:hypothetical protein [Saprospiraceae bacterium]
MSIFTNTNQRFALVAAMLATTFISFTSPVKTAPGDPVVNPWTMLHRQDGIGIFYDIQDCLKDNLLLCIKLVNDSPQTKKLRFRTEVLHPDGSMETFNFIKTIEPYSLLKADCTEAGRQSGLLRALKHGSENSVVTIHFNEGATASN